jgi:hypothetical protein
VSQASPGASALRSETPLQLAQADKTGARNAKRPIATSVSDGRRHRDWIEKYLRENAVAARRW